MSRCTGRRFVTCVFQVKTSSWDADIRAEAQIEVVRCAIQQRWDGCAWKQGQKKSIRGPQSHLFHSWAEPLKQIIFVIWQQRTQQRSPKPTFSFFPVLWRVLGGGRGELLLYETAVLFETTFNCWIDLLRVAKEKSGVNNNTTLLRQSTGNGALLSGAS